MRSAPCTLALVLLLPTAGGAQVHPDTGRSDTLPAIPLAPIRVTVLRTPLPLSRVPYAVTVEPVAGSGPGLTLAESLGPVPGLQVDNRYNFSQGDRISVRGLGARAQFGVRGVKVLVDGIPATLPDGQTSLSHLDPRRVVRAEVVRGPASSLWGNAAGGVIQLETARPPADGGRASTTWLAGADGLVHVGGEAGAGARGLGVRAAASRLIYDGFRAHAGADKRFGSARVDWSGSRDTVTVVAHAVAYEADNPGSLSAELLAEDRTQAYGFNVVQGAGEAAEQGQLGITWHHGFGGPGHAELLELSAWGLGRSLDNPIPPAIIELGRTAAGARVSLRGGARLAGSDASWVVGLDAEGQWDDRRNYENLGGDAGALVLDQAETVRSVAPFAELVAPVGPARAVAGLRYDHHRFAADDRLVTPTDPDDSGRRVMAQLSPSFGVVAEVLGAGVYANVASSFETPTTTELTNRPGGGAGFNPLKPQRAWSVEAGVRADLGGEARVHAAVYRIGIQDALIPFEDASAPGRTFFRNAGSAVHRGAELDLWMSPAPRLVLRLGYAWVDARFDGFVIDGRDVGGNRVPGVAPHRVQGSVAWTPVPGANVALAGRWVDAIPVDDANTASAPAYTLLDLRAAAPALPVAGGAIAAFGGVDNLLAAEYVTSVVVNAFGGRYYEPGPGRSFYVGLRLGRQ